MALQASRVLILDLSASMDAADLAPSRLERARFKITDILARTREGRTGMVVFAGEPHIVTPLTEDGDTIANLLSALSTDIVPAAGDAGAPALRMAGDLLEKAGVNSGDLLLLTDGLSDPAAALGVAYSLRDQGHRLSVLGVGTAQGAPIPRSDGGFSGMARLNVTPLQELARTGDGAFSALTAGDGDLDRVLFEPQRSAPVREMEGSGVERWIEQGVWLLPLLVLLGATGFRRGWLAGIVVILVIPPPVGAWFSHQPSTAAAQRRALSGVHSVGRLDVVPTTPAPPSVASTSHDAPLNRLATNAGEKTRLAFEWRDLWFRPDQQAANALEQGQPEAAARRFVNPAWRGMALYKAGDYPGAAQAFAESKGVDAGYNRGNALARAGQLEKAAGAYRQVLKQAPGHADAKANLALVEKLLQQQQQPQQDQSREGRQEEDAQQQQQSQSGEGKEQQKPGDHGNQSSGEDEKKESPAEMEKGQGKADVDQGQDEEASQQQPDPGAGSEDQKKRSGREQEDSMESARRDVADQARSEGRSGEEEKRLGGLGSEQGGPPREAEPLTEAELALDQWLRQIPEDPAGLLRRKFMLEHLRRKQELE